MKDIFSKGNISLLAITFVIALVVGLITAIFSSDKVNIVAMAACSGIAVTLGIDNLGKLVGMQLGCKEASAFGVIFGVIAMLILF